MLKSFFLIASFLLSLNLFSADFLIHEAFIAEENRMGVYETISQEPPQPKETTPSQKPAEKYGEKIVWISGYWVWSGEKNDFIWVSGLWRKVPLGRMWIAGRWEEKGDQWVRLPGFWSDVKEEELRYIPKSPPDTLDQMVPPAPSTAFFWILGHYEYNFIHERFDWLEGRWEAFDERRVYVPSTYLWQGERGYVYVSAYWDWPLEERGEHVETNQILEKLFPYWPNYLYFFQTHYHFHPDFWEWEGESVIPWWKWNEWWAFTWQDQWWLWWWWSHPGYPQPPWMSVDLSNQITPPSTWILTFMEAVKPPLNVTEEGVMGNRDPVKRPFLRPTGEKSPLNLRKPFFGPSHEELERAPRRVAIIPVLEVPKEPPPPPPRKKPERKVLFHRSNL